MAGTEATPPQDLGSGHEPSGPPPPCEGRGRRSATPVAVDLAVGSRRSGPTDSRRGGNGGGAGAPGSGHGLAGSLVGRDDRLRDASPVADLVPVLPSPFPNRV